MNERRTTLRWLLVLTALLDIHAASPPVVAVLWTIGLFLPPSTRLQLGQEAKLKEDCQRITYDDDDSLFVYDDSDDITQCDYRLATKIFSSVADGSRRSSAATTVWFPRLPKTKALNNLIEIIDKNHHMLGIDHVSILGWPEHPCTGIRWRATTTAAASSSDEIRADRVVIETEESSRQSAIQDTEHWVTNTLCKLGLCPYTYSLQRAPVGLDTAGVKEGPIVVRLSSSDNINSPEMFSTPAAGLAKSFWAGVTELAERPEEEVATLLIVAPTYDDELKFLEFCRVFDELLEPSVQATGSEALVGRAIFHPSYSSEIVGHKSVKPGHALPADMVGGFVDRYLEAGADKPNLDAIAQANDQVRWTPHATINLLRRSQLTAAKEVEALSQNKRPNWIYAKNVLRLIRFGEKKHASVPKD